MATIRQAGPVIELTAGPALSGHKAIALVAGVAVHADQSNPAHRGLVRGISTGAVASGATLNAQVYGRMYEPSWAWTPDLPIYVGANGALTQTRPTSGWLQRLAIADSATLIFIDPQPPIVLG
jgi:hypothetical protein